MLDTIGTSPENVDSFITQAHHIGRRVDKFALDPSCHSDLLLGFLL